MFHDTRFLLPLEQWFLIWVRRGRFRGRRRSSETLLKAWLYHKLTMVTFVYH